MEELRLLLSALKCAVLDEPMSAEASPEVWQKVFVLSRAHDLALPVSEGLEKGGVSLPPKVNDAFVRAGGAGFGRFCSQNLAMGCLTKALEAAGIDYMPLKGAVLRALYPIPEWRVGRDVDILVRRADFDCARTLAIEALAPVRVTEGGHDVGLETAGGVRVELHFSLFTGNEGFGELLRDPFANAYREDGSNHCYRLPDEELYAYHLAHMAKHFRNGGCGLRAFLDLFLLRRSIGPDACARGNSLLTKAGLKGFAAVACRQSDVLYGGLAGDADTERLSAFIAANQAFGSFRSEAAAFTDRSGRRKGRLRRWLARAFPAYHAMCYLYPILRRWPVFLPFCWLLRAFRVFSKKDRNRFLAASRASAQVNAADVERLTQIYNYLKLDG